MARLDPMRIRVIAGAAVLATAAVAAAGCGSRDAPAAASTTTASSSGGRLPQGSEAVRVDPRDFTTKIDNPWLPMAPGTRWVYRDTPGRKARDTITVTNRTKVVAGVTVRIVHDVATEDGEVIEDTLDYFAQDRRGNVWYFGEATHEFENGKPASSAGSWETGVHNAQAGIAMPARPRAGVHYRQEYRKGHAEDRAAVLSVNEQVQAPFGHFAPALLTKEFTPVEPKALEYKLYAKGIGQIASVGVSGDSDREDLISYRKGAG